MALVQRASAPPHVELPLEYMNIRMRKDEKFKDFYWRVRNLEKNLCFQPDTTDHQATIQWWFSRLTINLIHKLRTEDNGTLKFESVYHLFERCCRIELQDRVNEIRELVSICFSLAKSKNWALFEAEVDKREKLLGYFDIDDPEELSEKRRIDSWLVRLLPAELELLRIHANGLENVKTEMELLECLRQVEFGPRWEELIQNPLLSRYWWDIRVKDMASQQEAATQSVENQGERQKSLAPGGHEEQEQEATVPATKEKSRKKKKIRRAQEEDEGEEQMSSPPVVKDRTQKRKKDHKIKQEVDEEVALPPVVEAKPRKFKKRVHFEDDDDEVEEPPPTFKDKSRRRKSRKAEVDEEEVVSSPMVRKKSRKGSMGRRAKEDEEEEEEYVYTPVVKEKRRKSKKKSRQVEDEDEQLASPPATKHKSRKRKRSHVETDSDEAEADSSDFDEKPRKRKKIRAERREKRRG